MGAEQFLTVAQAAEKSEVSEAEVRGWITSRALPAEQATDGSQGRPGYRIKESDLLGA